MCGGSERWSRGKATSKTISEPDEETGSRGRKKRAEIMLLGLSMICDMLSSSSSLQSASYASLYSIGLASSISDGSTRTGHSRMKVSE